MPLNPPLDDGRDDPLCGDCGVEYAQPGLVLCHDCLASAIYEGEADR